MLKPPLKKPFHPSLLSQLKKAHQWVVYKHKDGTILANQLNSQKDIIKYQTSDQIENYVTVIAFTRPEAWRKGKDLLQIQ